ncbi:hypothetical protein EDB85DRAFT_2141018 [Lactarius pseudohatsudake]|nr:hypothetical protein EDB85DRAFT_2141018 [Lactarius pseudohatsudake]
MAHRPLAFGSTPSPLAAPPIRTEGVHTRARHRRPLPLPLSRPLPSHEGAHEDTTPPAPPFPIGRAALYAQQGGTRGHAIPGPTLPHSRGRGVREGMPPPFPAAPTPPLPAPSAWGTRGHAPLVPPFPIRAEGGCARACRPPSPLPPTPPLPAPSARGTRGHAPLVPPFPIHAEGGCTRVRCPRHLSSPLVAPPRTHGKGACEGPAPPFLIRAEGVCTRARRPVRAGRGARGQAVPASPHVAQQGRHGLCAPTFTAPAPHFRAP